MPLQDVPMKRRSHPNHDGKAVPSFTPRGQIEAFSVLSHPRDYVEVKRGSFLALIPDVECRGYFVEIGTNIITKNKPKVPGFLLELAEKCAHENVESEIRRNSEFGKRAESGPTARRACEFVQFVTALTYAAWNQLQGPYHNNGTSLSCWICPQSHFMIGPVQPLPMLNRFLLRQGIAPIFEPTASKGT